MNTVPIYWTFQVMILIRSVRYLTVRMSVEFKLNPCTVHEKIHHIRRKWINIYECIGAFGGVMVSKLG